MIEKNGYYGNPPDYWWWCLCMHMYCLFQGFKTAHTTRICLWQLFSAKVKSVCHGAIIDNRTYAPICVLEKKDRSNKDTLKNMLRKLFEVTCIVKYVFKVTSHDSPCHITDLYLLLYFDSTRQIGILKTETNSYSNLPENWFGYDTISEQWYKP